ncbi:hypothetical protein [Candidatus Kurthia intestinigallinarum]|uniref:hypothetical protein n=1 Tax=Candidatus Kurthia intestinigallinarum TaxID=1562256 RepID=UPI0013152300|nr:hypothetical protein [Kurthia sp. 3B1D]
MMSKARILFLIIITVVIAALCWITYAGGRGDLAIYYVFGFVLLIVLEIVRIITQKKTK